MPWTAMDARRFTKKARGREKREAWAKTANAVLASGQTEAVAVHAANKHIKEMSERDKRDGD